MANKYMTTEYPTVTIHNALLNETLTENTTMLTNMTEGEMLTINDYTITCDFNSYHDDDMADNDRWVDLLITKKIGLVTVAIRATFNYQCTDWDYDVTDVTINDLYL